MICVSSTNALLVIFGTLFAVLAVSCPTDNGVQNFELRAAELERNGTGHEIPEPFLHRTEHLAHT